MVSGYDRCDRYKKSDPYAYQFLYNHHNRYRIRKKNPERTWIKTDAYWYIFICNDRYCLCEMVFIKSERSLRSLEWNWGLTQRSLSQQLVDRRGVVSIRSSTITKPFQAIIWKANLYPPTSVACKVLSSYGFHTLPMIMKRSINEINHKYETQWK